MFKAITTAKPPFLRPLLLCAALLVAFTVQASWALAGTLGGIAGVVTDAKTGAPISGVQLQISSPSQTVTTTTDAKGHFIALSLQPDTYTLTAEKDGYDTRETAGYSVSADQTQRYDLSLTPASPQAPPGNQP
jgi:carboxypeptidase family protein